MSVLGYTKAGADGKFAPLVLTPADSLHGWGHSYMFGITPAADPTADTMLPVAAEMLGLPARNEGVSGSTLGVPASGCSWSTVMQKVTRPRRFSTPTGAHVVMFGINDLNAFGNTTANLAPFTTALRAVIARLRAGAIFEESDASIAYGGDTWTSVSLGGYSSGTNVKYATTDGAYFTITTPADFPGGTLAVGLMSWNSVGYGAVIASSVINGQTYSIDTRAPSANYSPFVLRIPNVPAGSATYTFTASSSGAIGAVLDYWQWEPDSTKAPLVVLVKQPKPLDYTQYGSVAPGPPTDAGVDNLNAIISNVAAEFDSRVLVVDTSSLDHDSTCFTAGNVHPTLKGHRLIATKIRDAVNGALRVQHVPQSAAPRGEYGTVSPASLSGAGAQTYWNAGDRVTNTAPAEAGTAGSKYVVTGWVCTVAGNPGTWVPTRALTGN